MIDKRLIWTAAATLIPAIAIACGDSPSGVDDDDDDDVVAEGMITAAVHDSSAVLPNGRTTAIPADSMAYEGTMTGTAQVEVHEASGDWVSLGDPVEITFSLYCENAGVVQTDSAVPVGTYDQVRVTLDGFTASILAGSIISTVTYDSAQSVDLGAAAFTVEKTVTPFVVTEGSSTEILFDLNSEVWLNATTLTNHSVASADVAAATVVYVR